MCIKWKKAEDERTIDVDNEFACKVCFTKSGQCFNVEATAAAVCMNCI